jgi:hypothetical protein
LNPVVQALATSRSVLGLAAAIWLAACPGALAQSVPPLGSAAATLGTPQGADKAERSSQRTISKHQHRPPEPYTPPRPALSQRPPLTLSIAPIPLPDPRPPALFNKDFPGLKFEREQEYGFTGRGG